MWNPVRGLFGFVAGRLGRAGLIDADRGERIGDLAWPRFLTMFARSFYRVADAAMVGLAVGSAAIAGMAFAGIYWSLANAISAGLAGAAIGQVSQRFGADEHRELELVVKGAILLGLVVTVPIVWLYWTYSEPLIALAGDDQASIRYGGAYLKVFSLALLFNLLNYLFSRTLAGADDTWIAMSVRATGAAVNVVLNAVFIFGLGMGVTGAALGTVISEAVVTVAFSWGFLSGSVPVLGTFPVTVSLSRPYVDLGVLRQLLRISPPLVVERLVRSLALFPVLAVLATFGPVVVAAYEVSRRVKFLMGASGSGFSMAASSLVGQELGRGDEFGADNYARDVLRFSAVIYSVTAVLVAVFAGPIAGFFAEDPETVARTAPFIRVTALAFLAYGVARSFDGILKAAGDTRWILYSRLVSQYLVLIPIMYLGTVTPLGVMAVFAAMLSETAARALVTGYRVTSGKWKLVSRAYRPDAAD